MNDRRPTCPAPVELDQWIAQPTPGRAENHIRACPGCRAYVDELTKAQDEYRKLHPPERLFEALSRRDAARKPRR